MKLLKILEHPLSQLLSFSIILVGSPYFGGPYIFFVFFSSLEGFLYGILGMIGAIVTFLSIFFKRNLKVFTQFLGLTLMIASLIVDFIQCRCKHGYASADSVLPLFTLLLFISISAIVFWKTLKNIDPGWQVY